MTGQDEPLFPEGIGDLLSAILTPEQQPGPPYVHTFQPPEPVLVLDGYGQPVLDGDGEPVMGVPLLPSYTLTSQAQPLEPEEDKYPDAVGRFLREALGAAYVDKGPVGRYPTIGDLMATAAALNDRFLLYGTDAPTRDWSTHDGFVADFGEPVALVPHLPRKPKRPKRRRR